MLRGLWHGLVVVLLTLLTQLGGLAWLLALGLARGRLLVFLMWFLASYAGLSAAARILAPEFGREAVGCWPGTDSGVVAPPLFCALNRTYATPELAALLRDLAKDMAERHPGTRVHLLDAGFPFGDGFPLLPHLSHDDGEKADLAFWYEGGGLRSPIGYWAFETPLNGAPLPCADTAGLTLRWDMQWFQVFVRDLPLDEARTATAINWLTEHLPRGGKILIEPHLAARLGVEGGPVRFQGCRAARHDDHIHIQL